MKRKHLWFAIVLLVLLIIPGSWLAWFHTRPVYDAKEWAEINSTSPEFILYLFDATPSNAVRVLRDGLMNELARSGLLPPGYPKLVAAPKVIDPPCQDKNLAADDRYFIQLSDAPDNYIKLPLCPRTAMDSHLVIHILQAWPWAQAQSSPKIFIGMSRNGSLDKRHVLKPGQEELILESLTKLGAKLYLNWYFEDLLRKTQ